MLLFPFNRLRCVLGHRRISFAIISHGWSPLNIPHNLLSSNGCCRGRIFCRHVRAINSLSYILPVTNSFFQTDPIRSFPSIFPFFLPALLPSLPSSRSVLFIHRLLRETCGHIYLSGNPISLLPSPRVAAVFKRLE